MGQKQSKSVAKNLGDFATDLIINLYLCTQSNVKPKVVKLHSESQTKVRRNETKFVLNRR